MRPSRRQMQPFTRRWSGSKPSVTAVLIALHVGAFAAQAVFALLHSEVPLPADGWTHWLALDAEAVSSGEVWKFFTFPFIHAEPAPLHLLANMCGLFFAGREVEPIVGRRHFLAIYILGSLVGGAVHLLAMPSIALLGASAGVAALLGAYATILPELDVTVNIFFILPLRIRTKYIGLLLIAACIALWATHIAATIGPAAMLAAVVVGWAYVKQLGFGNPLAIQRYIFKKRERHARIERMSAAQFIDAEIDPILDKISREGMHSLTRSERKILDKGREKIAARASRK